jgi:ankyrin repeat protein
MNTADVTPDIVALIKSRVEDLALDESRSHEVRNLVQKKLKDGAQGTFLWTAMVLQDLNRLGEDITMTKISNILNSIPQVLEDYYTRVLERIPTKNRKAAARIFNILLTAQRSLHQDELAVAFFFATTSNTYTKHSEFKDDLRLNFSGYAKGVCTSLITVADKRIEIVHQSARAFLLSLPSNSLFYPSLLGTHDLMSKVCLEYLLLEDFTKMDKESGFHGKYPFISYASTYWSRHVRESKQQLVHCKPFLRKFLSSASQNFAFWFRHLRTFEIPLYKRSWIKSTDPVLLHTIVQHRLSNIIQQSQIGNQHMDDPLLHLDINERDKWGRTPLYTAVTIDDNEILQQLLALNADPNLADTDGKFPLHEAIERRNAPATAELLQRGADVTCTAKDGTTAFHMAAASGDAIIVNRLIELGIDPKEKSNDGSTSLYWAALNGHVAIVDRLVELGVDPKEKTNDGLTSLCWAAFNGHIAMVDRLIELGMDPKEKENDGWTSLHWAAQNGHIAMVDRFVELGVDPKEKTNDGWTSLCWAALNGHIAIIDRLVELGVDPKEKTNDGFTS